MREIRKLRADEINVRVARIGKQSVNLVLYKNARTDMDILDETFGSMNWMREHRGDNKNCVVSVYDDDKQQWICKEDTGTEGNVEQEKSLASDSFKRACTNIGIGRELYTAPRILFPRESVRISNTNGGGETTWDRFEVVHIDYKDNKISELKVKDVSTGVTLDCFENEVYGELANPCPATDLQREIINLICEKKNMKREVFEEIKKELHVGNTKDMTKLKAEMLIERLQNA